MKCNNTSLGKEVTLITSNVMSVKGNGFSNYASPCLLTRSKLK